MYLLNISYTDASARTLTDTQCSHAHSQRFILIIRRKQNRNYMVLHIIYFSWHALSARCGLLFMLNSYYFVSRFSFLFISFHLIFFISFSANADWRALHKASRLWPTTTLAHFNENEHEGKNPCPVKKKKLFSNSTKCWLFRRNA